MREGRGRLDRRHPRERAEKDAPEREDVGRGHARLARGLLRGAVSDRADERARDREALEVARRGETEVGEPGPALGVDEDVRGLHVPVNDPLGVDRPERARHVADRARRLERVELRLLLEDGLEARAVDVVEDHVGTPVRRVPRSGP